jgi:hypothetical protein
MVIPEVYIRNYPLSLFPEKKIKKYGGPAGSALVQLAGMKCRDLKGYKRRNTKW